MATRKKNRAGARPPVRPPHDPGPDPNPKPRPNPKPKPGGGDGGGGLTPEQKKAAAELADELKRYGLQGDYMDLIDAAVRGDWTETEFILRITKTDAFSRQFPGLMDKGDIAAFLGVGPIVSPSALGTAIDRYYQLQNSYEQAAGYYGYHFGKEMLSQMIAKQVSPDEFARRLQAVDVINKNPNLGGAFNEALKAFGMGPMSLPELWRWAAGEAPQKFYDVYEAAQIKQGDLGLDIDQAKAIAENVDLANAPGAPASIAELVAQARQNLQTIGPELQRQGMTTAALVKALANPGLHQREMGMIAQVLNTRKTLAGSYVPGSQARQGTAGGPAVFPQPREAGYG